MSKRYTDTNIFSQSWFQDLTPENKLIWWYLERKCDHAGIYKIDIIMMKRELGIKEINLNDFLDEINKDYDKLTGESIKRERVKLVDKYLWITSFIQFQQDNKKGVNENVPAVKSALNILRKMDLFDYAVQNSFITLSNSTEHLPNHSEPLSRVIDIDKDLDKDIVIDSFKDSRKDMDSILKAKDNLVLQEENNGNGFKNTPEEILFNELKDILKCPDLPFTKNRFYNLQKIRTTQGVGAEICKRAATNIMRDQSSLAPRLQSYFSWDWLFHDAERVSSWAHKTNDQLGMVRSISNDLTAQAAEIAADYRKKKGLT